MKPNDIYKSKSGEKSYLYEVLNCLTNYLSFDLETTRMNENKLVYSKEHYYESADCRFICITSIWYMDKPVAISQDAGRYSGDYAILNVTDKQTFNEMIVYLSSLRDDVKFCTNQFNPDEELDRLSRFYSKTFEIINGEVVCKN